MLCYLNFLINIIKATMVAIKRYTLFFILISLILWDASDVQAQRRRRQRNDAETHMTNQ